uniref:Uncharacterized protein n=1 Tax=Triticum urartu TaxID=4572 RepID=A0A8R7Q421_TRIUA
PAAGCHPPTVVRPINPHRRGLPIDNASPSQPHHRALPNHHAAHRHPHCRAPPAIPASMTPPLSSRSAVSNFGSNPVEQLGPWRQRATAPPQSRDTLAGVGGREGRRSGKGAPARSARLSAEERSTPRAGLA